MVKNIFSIIVLEWLVILTGCKVNSINELDASEYEKYEI